LKKGLQDCQSKLKAITQIYRDDQEKRTNAREREENRFANMRKKLDLQVKNRRYWCEKINYFWCFRNGY
jgi:hypothetical protein